MGQVKMSKFFNKAVSKCMFHISYLQISASFLNKLKEKNKQRKQKQNATPLYSHKSKNGIIYIWQNNLDLA